jgi:hypothetical protein
VKRSRSAPVGVWMRSGGSGAAGAERLQVEYSCEMRVGFVPQNSRDGGALLLFLFFCFYPSPSRLSRVS